MANIEEKVENLISETINNLGYELYDVIYEKEARDYYLRIFIDKQEGISIEDCEKVNDAITDMLDEADYIKEQYLLEVSSPGIERLLRKEKHLKQSIGSEVTCSLYKPLVIEEPKGSEESTKTITEEIQNKKQCKLIKKQKSKKQEKQSFKQIDGILKDFDETKIVLQINVEGNQDINTILIDRKNISNLKLKYNW